MSYITKDKEYDWNIFYNSYGSIKYWNKRNSFRFKSKFSSF